jgi:hypothetical protein
MIAAAALTTATARVHVAAAHFASARVHLAAAHPASARVHVAAAHFASAHVHVAAAHFASAHVHVTAVMSRRLVRSCTFRSAPTSQTLIRYPVNEMRRGAALLEVGIFLMFTGCLRLL